MVVTYDNLWIRYHLLKMAPSCLRPCRLMESTVSFYLGRLCLKKSFILKCSILCAYVNIGSIVKVDTLYVNCLNKQIVLWQKKTFSTWGKHLQRSCSRNSVFKRMFAGLKRRDTLRESSALLNLDISNLISVLQNYFMNGVNVSYWRHWLIFTGKP